MNWTEIEQVEGFKGLKAFLDSSVAKALEALPVETLDKGGAPKGLGATMTLGFVLCGVMFISTFWWLPDTWWGNALRIVLFFAFFLLGLGIALYLNRNKIAQYMVRTVERITVRAEAMSAICDYVGLNFVPMPGGAPASLMFVANHKWAPPELKAFGEQAEATMGGMDAAVDAAKATGLLSSNVIILGTTEQAEKYNSAGQHVTVEDGFHGTRSGISFDAFEWIESQSEDSDIYHLTIVLTAPLRLSGLTELRARKLTWAAKAEGQKLNAVDLGPKAFADTYRLRASDQTEARALFNPAVIERVIALAHGEPFRAIAQNQHLVFDFAGDNRFEIMDVKTGQWSDESLRKGISDMAEMLALVDALAHAFMVRKTAP